MATLSHYNSYIPKYDERKKKLNRLALISVYDKKNCLELAKSLFLHGYTIIASGGTFNYLHNNLKDAKDFDISELISIEKYTQSPEMLGGRVKTLHPKIHAGILAQREHTKDIQDLNVHHILPIDIIAVNLYPFEQTINKKNIKLEDAIEQIDIGGVTLMRAAAKNFTDVIVLSDPKDYMLGIELIDFQNQHNPKDKKMCLQQRLKFSSKAFSITAYYEATIAKYIEMQAGAIESLHHTVAQIEHESTTKQAQAKLVDHRRSKLSAVSSSVYTAFPLQAKQVLRYGENPHQHAILYARNYPKPSPQSLIHAKQLHGKELSFNNIRDAEAAVLIANQIMISKLSQNSILALGIKHGNPCGVALKANAREAWRACYHADNISIFGGIVLITDTINKTVAIELSKLFLEIIIAPKFDADALAILKEKKNLRLLQLPISHTNHTKVKTHYTETQLISIQGGVLVQDYDNYHVSEADLTCVTTKKPSKKQITDLLFAFNICKYVKSNAIVIAKNLSTCGIGAGQMNRVGAAKLALDQAAKLKSVSQAVLASDAFFPMPDTVNLAAKYGISAIIQPGGSIKDKESIAACNKHKIAMVCTKIRHFLH